MREWVRAPAVAGRFYPADPVELAREVDGHVAAATVGDGPAPKAIIAPHAGYVYSGPVAGSAYARLRLRAAAGAGVVRVVLAGPAHHVAVRTVATSSAAGFDTPLGVVPVDDELRSAAISAGAAADDHAHAPEHSLEVQLPFLQRTFEKFAILPLAVGPHGVDVFAAVLDDVWGGRDTAVVISTDLSHYHDQRTAEALDARTAEAIVDRRAEDLRATDACGCWAVQGMLVAARRHGLDVELLDLRTSADTAGSADRVVGYGAFALSERAV